MTNIAVTGVGAVVGHGVVKSIRLSRALHDARIIGMDMNPDASGFIDCDGHYISERVTSPGYVEGLLEICKKENINVFIPLIEDEFLLVDDNRSRFRESGTHVILQPRSILDTFMDKYDTAMALQGADIPAPETLLFTPENLEAIRDLAKRHGFPLFAKPRRGRSSKGLVLINSDRQILQYMDILKGQPYVVQEFLREAEEEYTCCIFTM